MPSEYLIDKKKIVKESGHCFCVHIPEYHSQSDNAKNGHRSKMILYEDSYALDSPHSVHENIRKYGLGIYSYFFTNPILLFFGWNKLE